jgi:mRNA interferase MazF
MEKDFDGWNERKKKIDSFLWAPFFQKREIWWCYLGLNIGYEQNGSGKKRSRPVLVLRGLSRTTCLVVPLTTSNKQHPYRVSVGTIDGKEAQAIISQIRVVDTKRFINRIAILNVSIFEEVRKSATELL